MKDSSDHNKVKFLLDEEFFKELHRQLVRVRDAPNDGTSYVLIAMWLCKLKSKLPAVTLEDERSEELLPKSPSKTLPETTLKDLLAAITKKGHKVKFVLWNGSNPVAEPLRTLAWTVLKAPKAITGDFSSEPLSPGFMRFGGGSKVFADEVRIWGMSDSNVGVYLESYRPGYTSFGTSNHQKVVVCSVGGKLSALVGGFNLNEKYSAQLNHANANQGWHDTAVLLKGPAAHSVQQEWLRRWNKQYYTSSSHETLPATREAQVPAQEKLKKATWNSKVTIATTNGEARPAEKHIRELMIERIKAAKNYIYIENYAFTDPALIEALAKKMAKDKGVKVMVLIHHPKSPLYSNDTLWSYLQYYSFLELALARFQRIRVERNADNLMADESFTLCAQKGSESEITATSVALQKSKLGWSLGWSSKGVQETCQLSDIKDIVSAPFMYAPQTTTEIDGKSQWPYPHSKLALFDDEIAFVGSSNWTYRSMEYDGEITAMIEDKTVVTNIRERLFNHWQEGLSVENFEKVARQNIEDVNSEKMKKNQCFIVPLRLGDFLAPDKAALKTKWGMDLMWTWF